MKLHEQLELAFNAQLRDSEDKINQTDRNALRATLLSALCEDLGATMTTDGAILTFEHEYWGRLSVEVSLKMKDPEYDVETAAQEHLNKLRAAEEKRIEAMKKAAERETKRKATKKE